MWNEQAKFTSRENIEARILSLTAEFRSGNRSDDLITQVEVLAAAAFVDPVAQTPRSGEMKLSKALARFNNSTPDEFKKVFAIGNYGRDVDQVYEFARNVKGRRVAQAILEDVLSQTGDPAEVSMFVIERLASQRGQMHATGSV